jgi:hypothetical protein
LQLVWAAVNRSTAEGPVAGPRHKLPLDVALKAVTLDAAYSIRMEKQVGSIEVGKDANLTVLDRSPYAVAPANLKDIAVWGTMLEGRLQPVTAAKVVPKPAAAATATAPAETTAPDGSTLARAVAANLATLLSHDHQP